MSNVQPPPANLSRALSSAGAVIVAFELTRRVVIGELPLFVYVVSAISVLFWVAVIVLPRRAMRVIYVLLAVMVLLGASMAAATDGTEVALIAVGLVSLSRDIRVRIRVPIVIASIAIVIVLLSAIWVPITALGVLSIEAGVVVSFLLGQSRRQFVLSELQRARLGEEEARASLLAERQHIAHDIHDVLAHSLGGLVIQLDAVDALLEAGDSEAAAARVRDARRLAADGMSEARRAVAALREGPVTDAGDIDASAMVAELQQLVVAHRALGGEVEFVERGTRETVSAALATALRRAVQEGLTNARKHAPGHPVAIWLDWGAGDVALKIENAVGSASVDHTGGGNGLVGMRERFAVLPGGVATAALESGRFVVRVGGETA